MDGHLLSENTIMVQKINAAVLGASGYTGAELLRYLIPHPYVTIKALTADRKAGQTMADVFPQFTGHALPPLITIAELELDTLDTVFCALPHGTTQNVIADLFAKKPTLKIIDLSADFRLHNAQDYAAWYGHAHQALHLQEQAVYGLTEIYRDQIRNASLVANPGCHSSTAILPLFPLFKASAISAEHLVIDSKTGMSGAGRAPKEEMLFSEISSGVHAYGVGKHRHTAELDQELSLAAGKTVAATFTPHILPMNRGIYSTAYVTLEQGFTAQDLHAILAKAYEGEYFVHVLPFGTAPQSRHVRGSNHAFIGVVADRFAHRAVVICTTDNLAKGASGQAVQNMNTVFGWPEHTGLENIALFP